MTTRSTIVVAALIAWLGVVAYTTSWAVNEFVLENDVSEVIADATSDQEPRIVIELSDGIEIELSARTRDVLTNAIQTAGCYASGRNYDLMLGCR